MGKLTSRKMRLPWKSDFWIISLGRLLFRPPGYWIFGHHGYWIFGYHGYLDIMDIRICWILGHDGYLDVMDICI